MQTEQHRGKSLTYLSILPDGYDPEKIYPLVIMLHGYGVNMHDLAGLTSMISTTGYIYICPNAPIPLNSGPGMVGWAWTTPGESDNADEVERVQRRLETLYAEVTETYQTPQKNAILLGFSQGGSMTYRTGLMHPELFTGLVALSCWLPDPELIRSTLPEDHTQSVFIAHGLQDNIDSARRSKDFLESLDYSLAYNEYDMGHEINQQVLEDLIAWLNITLPPLA